MVKGAGLELIGLGWGRWQRPAADLDRHRLATLVAGLLLAGLAARRRCSAAGQLSSRQSGRDRSRLLALIVPPIFAVLAIITAVCIARILPSGTRGLGRLALDSSTSASHARHVASRAHQ